MPINNHTVVTVSALCCAASFVFGFVLLLTTMMPYVENADDAQFAVQFVNNNLTPLQLWNFVIYIGFGLALLLLVISLHRLHQQRDTAASQLAYIVGVLWTGLVLAAGLIGNVGLTKVVTISAVDQAQAQALWLAVNTLKHALGGSNELIGGLWIILVSTVHKGWLPKALYGTGIAAGAAGILTVVPRLQALGALFGLMLIIWFIWLARVAGSSQLIQTSIHDEKLSL